MFGNLLNIPAYFGNPRVFGTEKPWTMIRTHPMTCAAHREWLDMWRASWPEAGASRLGQFLREAEQRERQNSHCTYRSFVGFDKMDNRKISQTHIQAGWWFQTFFIFHFIYGIILPIDFHIFQRGGSTTNQQPEYEHTICELEQHLFHWTDPGGRSMSSCSVWYICILGLWWLLNFCCWCQRNPHSTFCLAKHRKPWAIFMAIDSIELSDSLLIYQIFQAFPMDFPWISMAFPHVFPRFPWPFPPFFQKRRATPWIRTTRNPSASPLWAPWRVHMAPWWSMGHGWVVARVSFLDEEIGDDEICRWCEPRDKVDRWCWYSWYRMWKIWNTMWNTMELMIDAKMTWDRNSSCTDPVGFVVLKKGRLRETARESSTIYLRQNADSLLKTSQMMCPFAQ